MTADIFSRINHFKQYINELTEHLSTNDNPKASNTISKFKKVVMKEDPHQHANQFLLDCLKAKNEKLTSQLEQLQLEKKNKLLKMSQKRNNKKNMKEANVGIFISRLSVGLNDVKKVEYDDVCISCNYQLITINSLVGSKYKDHPLVVESISKIEQKMGYVHLSYQDAQNLNILIKFQEERDLKRWVLGIKMGIMIQNSKKRDKLFHVPKEEEPPASSAPSPKLAPLMPQIPLLSFNNHTKHPSPSQAVSMIEEKREKSLDRSFNDKMEKNTQRSLVNALSAQRTAEKRKILSFEKDEKSIREESFGGKSSNPNNREGNQPHIGYKYQQSRPPHLTRIRGLSENIENNTSFEISKLYKGSNKNLRKNSEDNWKPLINNTYHEKMLEIRRQQEAIDDQKSDSLISKSHSPQEKEKSPENRQQKEDQQKPGRIRTLEEKKKELLNRVHAKKVETPAFSLETHKISWADIQEMDDENKSKSSRASKQLISRRQSIVTESADKTSKGSKNVIKGESKESQHITEKSEQESPKFPKSPIHLLQLPRQINYTNGPTLRLHPVEKSSGFTRQAEQQEKNIIKSEQSKQSSSSSSESHQHSDPSSHQNHTESQDNAARSEELKKGITLTKCSENGFWSHQKIVYLSENQNDICCRDISDKKIKKIKISTITKIDYKKFDKGIMKHISKFDLDKCLVIRALMEDNKPKNFQFYGNNAEALERFANNLILFLQYVRKQ